MGIQQEYLDDNLVISLGRLSLEFNFSKKIQDKSKNQQKVNKSLSEFATLFKSVPQDPQAGLVKNKEQYVEKILEANPDFNFKTPPQRDDFLNIEKNEKKHGIEL